MSLMDLPKEQRQKIFDRRGITEEEYLANLAEFEKAERELEVLSEEATVSEKFHEPIKVSLDKHEE